MATRHPPRVVLAVARFLDGPDGPPRGSRGLVAVSGGADSTALALSLAALAPARDLDLVLGHVDHGLRPTSRDDAVHVRTLAHALGIEVRVTEVTVASRSNLEAEARRERYRALRHMAREVGATWIATAHTQDDQAETVLLRLLRGGGRGAIGGMRPARAGVLRPMLDATRADVRWYLGAAGAMPTEDPSNGDLRFARARVRHWLLPLLEREFVPSAVARLGALAERLRDEDDHLEEQAARRAMALGVGERLPAAAGSEPAALARRIVRRWLETRLAGRTSSRHVEAVCDLLRGPGGRSIAMPGRRLVERVGDDVCWKEEAATPAPFARPLVPGVAIVGPGATAWRILAQRLERSPGPSPLPTDPRVAVFDDATLARPLEVRSVRRGDRIALPGVGTRKLQDVLVDRKIPRGLRALVPVLTAAGEIVWVAGLARSGAARVGPQTQALLRVDLLGGEVFGLPGENRCDSLTPNTRGVPAGRR